VTVTRESYEQYRAEVLAPLAERIESYVRRSLSSLPRIDRISARAKSADRFLGKAAKQTDGVVKYADPLNQIQDQVGLRVVVFYLSDVEVVACELKRFLRPVEEQLIVPDSEAEFGYFGKHYIMLLPTDVYDKSIPPGTGPRFFELQIKTLFQHAWSEAEHDLGYKPTAVLTPQQRRCIAFSSAQAWGADRMFDELHRDLDGKS
jgi:putative GTP pyrophosphokinase